MSAKPIWDEATERALLGAMLMNSDALQVATQVVCAGDFFRPSHGRVFAAAKQLLEQGHGVDPVTVANLLDGADDKLVARSVAGDVPAASNAGLYAEQVANAGRRRRQVAAAEDIIHAAHNGGVTAQQHQRLVDELQPRPTGDPSFRVHATSELATLPPPEWLVPGFLVAGQLNVLFGPSDRFKSFIALDWALTIAAGQPWFGRQTRPGAIVYIAAEGGSGLWQRIEAWAEHRECDPPDGHWITEPVNLFDQAAAAELAAWIAALPIAPVLVVIDTIARCMAGGDENSAADLGAVIANTDIIRHRSGAAILGITHTGHTEQKRERGSSTLPGAADSRVRVGGNEQPLTVELISEKVKDDARPEPINLYLEPVKRSLVIARASTSRDDRENDLRNLITTYLAGHPAATQNDIEQAVPAKAKAVRDTLMALVNDQIVLRDEGPRGSYLHTLATASRPSDAVGRSQPRHPAATASRPPVSKGDAVAEPQTLPHDCVPTDEIHSTWTDPVDHDLDLADGDVAI